MPQHDPAPAPPITRDPRDPSSSLQAALRNYHTLDVRFTGNGGEYFRIWIVSSLLTALTLGLYWPWAKARRLRYFWSHTLVGGEPLAYHGNPRQMFKGQALIGVLFLLYSVAGQFSVLGGVVALLAVAGLWPALFRSGMVFKLGNTSWRGLRLHFCGGLPEAYRAVLPFLLPLLGLVLLGTLAPQDAPPQDELGPWEWGALGLLGLVVVLAPAQWWSLKAYQHRHYMLGGLRTGFRATAREFYGLALRFLLMLLAGGALIAGVIVLLTPWLAAGGHPVLAMVLGVALPLAGGLAVFSAIWPWWQVRMQNLVWTETGSAQLRFISRLRLWPYLLLQWRNALLTALTLGLYRPFAAVATARMRLQSVQIRSRVDLEGLLVVARASPQEAAGEAAGDAFGVDLGL
ncbi:YjgN family protein [Ideonella livida]|uniref:DUF898 domain-containing protein n=1 Tax=Ideonella livida TaxID=2707176 RepID=A0A7C9TJU6_9BURK|nr:YjgN family protein [Ideonella livida]NDY89886.1 DUF898 domain-containing protein [Ideonella livida]